jgi:hypothetical protein
MRGPSFQIVTFIGLIASREGKAKLPLQLEKELPMPM